METAITAWFLVISGWTPGGLPASVRSEAIYGPAKVCETRKEFDVPIVAAKYSLKAASGQCVGVLPKPPGLPEQQPHVPGKVSA